MLLKIIPFYSAGPFLLHATEELIQENLLRLFPGLGLNSDNLLEMLGINFCYDQGICSAIEFFVRDDQLIVPILQGKRLLGQKFDDVWIWISNLDDSIIVDQSGLISYKYGVSLSYCHEIIDYICVLSDSLKPNSFILDFQPMIGLRPIPFNSDRDQIRRSVNGSYQHYLAEQYSVSKDRYSELGVEIYYDSNLRCEAVKVFADSGLPVNIRYLNHLLLGICPFHIQEILSDFREKLIITNCSLVYMPLGVSFSGHLNHSLTGGYIEDILFFREGYYDAPNAVIGTTIYCDNLYTEL